MSDNRDVAAKLIGEAAETILRKRPGVHGSAENSFMMIGEMWTVFLRHHRQVRKHDNIMPQDVAQMMSILKKCRAIYGDKTNGDNFVDDIGYAALAGMLQLPDPAKNVTELYEEKFEQIKNDFAAELDKSTPSTDGFVGNDERSAPIKKGK